MHTSGNSRNTMQSVTTNLFGIFQNAHLHFIEAQVIVSLHGRRLLARLVQKIECLPSRPVLLVLHIHHVLLGNNKREICKTIIFIPQINIIFIIKQHEQLWICITSVPFGLLGRTY